MLSDSAALNSAAENLIASCRQVATSVTSESDRQLYWQRLSDSCSTIATKYVGTAEIPMMMMMMPTLSIYISINVE